ncbi:MAG: GAF domain-containing protein [Cytophagaceae bacterium]|jgi:hypothetical protein|nr:GAF domain-containing protein [Cytophagaceae bacterium]
MNKLTEKQIKLASAAAILLLFACIVVNHILSGMRNGVTFAVMLIVTVILLTLIVMLFGQLSKLERNETARLRSEFELERNALQEESTKLKSRLVTLEKQENIRTGNLLKETKLKNLVNGLLKGGAASSSKLLTYLVKTFQAVAAILYIKNDDGAPFVVKEAFGLPDDFMPMAFADGEGFNGQAAKDGKAVTVNDIPDEYFEVFSGLGQAKPQYLYLLPVLKDKQCIALIELATFEKNNLNEIWENVVEPPSPFSSPSKGVGEESAKVRE